MIKRMMIAIGTGLAILGSALGQAPVTVPIESQPATPGDAVPLETPNPASSASFDPNERFWATGDWMFSWFQGDRIQPLVTTSSAGTAQGSAGVLGFSTTSPLFGDSTVNNDLRVGFRLGSGYWFDQERTLGIEAGFTMLESQASFFAASSTGTPIIARPFIDATINQSQAVLVAFPGNSSGSIAVRVGSGNFYESHLDLSENIINCSWIRCDSLLGYRFYRYDEGLHIQQNITPTNGNFVNGTQVFSTDDFNTRNTFNGLDLGFRTQFAWDSLTLELLTKLAVGGIRREVSIAGSQVATVPGTASVTQAGGVYALNSNIGTHATTDTSIMPDIGANLNWQITPNIQARVGWSTFFMNRIARAADQVDFDINPNLFPPATNVGPSRPMVLLERSNMWVQNLSLGIEFNW